MNVDWIAIVCLRYDVSFSDVYYGAADGSGNSNDKREE